MINEIASELSALAAKLNIQDRVIFSDNDFLEEIRSVAPFGKVVVLYSVPELSEKVGSLTERLKAAGIKPLNFVIPVKAPLNLDDVLEIVGLPEDVRAIVATELELMPIASYLATVLNIPVIHALNSVNTEGLLLPKVEIKSRGGTDFFTTTCNYRIVLNGVPTLGDLAEQYISVISKLTALSDYRLKLDVCGGKPAADAYAAIKDAVLSAFSAEAPDALMLAGLKIELANFSAGGEIILNSAEYSFKRIMGFKRQKGLTFALLEKLLTLYKFSAEEREDPFLVPDYNKRAQELSAALNLDDGAFLNGLLTQLKMLKKRGDVLSLKTKFLNELTSQENALFKIERKYQTLGGTRLSDFSPYLTAFTLCGDLPDTVNLMTLARESGFTE